MYQEIKALSSEDCIELIESKRSAIQDKTLIVNFADEWIPDFPPRTLSVIAEAYPVEHRRRIARHPEVPQNILQLLANDSDVKVRRAVAANSAVSGVILKQLAADNDLEVIVNVAQNPNIPESILKAFIDEGQMLFEISTNPAAPVDILAYLSRSTSNYIRMNVAVHPRADESILTFLLNDSFVGVRDRLTENGNLSDALLKVLAKDKEVYATYHPAKKAREQLRLRGKSRRALLKEKMFKILFFPVRFLFMIPAKLMKVKKKDFSEMTGNVLPDIENG